MVHIEVCIRLASGRGAAPPSCLFPGIHLALPIFIDSRKKSNTMSTETQIAPADFKKRLDAGEIEFLFDLRNEDEFAAWRIEGKTPVKTLNIPQADFVGEEGTYLDRLPRDLQIIAVCAHGGASDYEAKQLREKGFDILSLAGGMDAWSEFYETHKLTGAPEIHQIVRVAKGCICHVLIDDGEAVIIDAVRHLDPILTVLEKQRARPVAVLDTHLQADHISGGPELAKRFGIPYFISPADAQGAAYTFTRLSDGTEIPFGAKKLLCLQTPGHTPGSVSFLCDNRLLFSGDTIMKSSIGRPDLGGMVKEWAHLLYRTIFERFAGVADDIVLLPTHAASAPREEDENGLICLTMRDFRHSQAYALKEETVFISFIEESLLENPERYQEIRKVNLGLLDPDEARRRELEIGKNLCGMQDKS